MPRPEDARFNIVIPIVGQYAHAPAFYEAAEYLRRMLLLIGSSAQVGNAVEQGCVNVLFGAHLLAERVDLHPAEAILFNTEQLGDAEGWHLASGSYRRLLTRFYVWDYSLANLARIPHPAKSFTPFLHCPGLARTDIRRKRGAHLLFYGVLTERRSRLLRALAQAGVPVRTLFGSYGYARDVQVFRSLAVLNLHKEDGTGEFEVIRCFHPLTNGIPVITEPSEGDPTFQIYRDCLFPVGGLDFPDRVAALCRSADFRSQADARAAAFRQTDGRPWIRQAVVHFLAWRDGRLPP